MANRIDITQIQDGPSDVVYHVYFESDGASGELTNFTIIDPVNIVNPNIGKPPLPPGNCFNIQQVWFYFTGFDANLQFASANPAKVVVLSTGIDSYADFRVFGGVADRTPASNFPTGAIQINTAGFSSAGCFGMLVIKVRKMYK